MSHANARLTVHGRLLLVQRVASGRPAAHVARELGISRQCAYRWVRRYAAGGLAGLADRSSRPRRMPRRAAPAVEARVVAARRGLRRGPQQHRRGGAAGHQPDHRAEVAGPVPGRPAGRAG